MRSSTVTENPKAPDEEPLTDSELEEVVGGVGGVGESIVGLGEALLGEAL